MSKQISRRAVLRGMGVAVALPALEAMSPLRAFAQNAVQAPLRMAFFSIPNGVNNTHWFPRISAGRSCFPRRSRPSSPSGGRSW
jgi:hypothetical protein